MNVECPVNYDCTFTHDPPPTYDVWWEGPWGFVVAILGLVAFTAIVITCAYYLWQHRSQVRAAKERERERNHKLAVEEQRAMQLDAAKGNPEMLKLIREMTR